MNRNIVIVVLLIILTGPLFVSQAYAKGEGTPNSVTLPSFVPGEILVKSKPGKSINKINSLFGCSTLQVDKRSGVQKVKLPPGESISYSITQYANNPDVEYAEPNFVSKISIVPNDSYYPNQWALTKINAPKAWDISKGSPSVVIAIIDSGIDYAHPDLSGKIVSPYNSVIDSTNITSVLDDMGHGTHVAGIAAASFNNETGVAGVGGNVGIMPIKAGYNGNFNSLDMANAIYYAVDHGARVINMSLGGHGYSYTLKAACDYAWEHNVVVVAAAGNDHTNLPEYPAAFNTVISVAATDQNDTDANFSNWGSWIAISAPGVNIYSTTPTYSNPLYLTNYDYSDGTSMSSSIVAGIAGLVLSVKPILTDSQVAGLILTNADDIDTPGYDYYTGFGRVNAYKTLTGAMAPSPTASALPAGGTYTSPQSVTLTASQSGCTIYYTTDGSNPTTASSQYYGPININCNTTLKYFAIGQTGTSKVYTQVYSIVPTATISPQGGLYDKPQQVTLAMSGFGGNIFYTLDGTNPTSNSSVFSQSITISSETVIKYIAVDKYGNQSQIYTQKFNIVPSVNASPIEGVITESTRLAGNDRLSTAVAISQKTFPNSRTADAVLLATGLDFPDALAGASLGKIKNAPLLLVTTYQDSKVTLDEIQRVLKPNGSVYILGGEGVVAPVFVTDLQGRGYNVRRLAGLNRYATAVAIAKEVKVSGWGEVIVATGQNFPDSLSISSYCAANGIPMVLVEQNKVPAEVENYLNTLQPTEITIVGGTGVVSTSVESRLKQLLPRLTTRRFGGIDRFETCVKITQGLFGNNSSLLFVATGIDFPDALAGSVLAGFNNAPIILINPTRLPDAILSYLTQLNHKKVVALGGEGVVSRDVYTKIIGYVQ